MRRLASRRIIKAGVAPASTALYDLQHNCLPDLRLTVMQRDTLLALDEGTKAAALLIQSTKGSATSGPYFERPCGPIARPTIQHKLSDRSAQVNFPHPSEEQRSRMAAAPRHRLRSQNSSQVNNLQLMVTSATPLLIRPRPHFGFQRLLRVPVPTSYVRLHHQAGWQTCARFQFTDWRGHSWRSITIGSPQY